MTTFADGEIEELDFVAASIRSQDSNHPTSPLESTPDLAEGRAFDPTEWPHLLLARELQDIVQYLYDVLAQESDKLTFIPSQASGTAGLDKSQSSRRQWRPFAPMRPTATAATGASADLDSWELVLRWDELLNDSNRIAYISGDMYFWAKIYPDHGKTPPFFWILEQGRKLHLSLKEFVMATDPSKFSVNDWDTTLISKWQSDTVRMLKKSGWIDNDGAFLCPDHPPPEAPILRLIPPTMVKSMPNRAPFCQAHDFVMWAHHELSPSDERSVGRLLVAYIFRSKEAPFHHDFVVFGFGDDSEVEPTTWVRIERAAQMPHNIIGTLIRAQSFGPLIGGVDPKETVSFSQSKSVLVNNAVEVARILLPAPTSTPIFMKAIARQISGTSASNDKYALFTSNCRWYARRNFLNILQWCDAAPIPYTVHWKGRETTPGLIREKLHKERFGGSKLLDHQARALDRSNNLLLNMVQGDLISLPPFGAILDGHLDAFRTTSPAPHHPDDETHHIAQGLLLQSRAAVLRGEFAQAVYVAEQAIVLLEKSPGRSSDQDDVLSWSFIVLGEALRLSGRYNHALYVFHQALPLHRPHTMERVDILSEIGLNYYLNEEFEKAIKALEDALKELYIVDHNHWANTLMKRAKILSLLARALQASGRNADALAVYREIMSIRRDLPNPEDIDDSFSHDLFALAQCAMDMKKYAMAKTALDAVVCCIRQDVRPEGRLIEALPWRAVISCYNQDVGSAIQDLTEFLALQNETDPEDRAQTRGELLKIVSESLIYVGDYHGALEHINETIDAFHRLQKDARDPEAVLNGTCEAYTLRAALLERLGYPDEAIISFFDGVDFRRHWKHTNLDENHLLNLITSLTEGAGLLRYYNRVEKARPLLDEAHGYLSILRNFQIQSQSLTISRTLFQALARCSELAFHLGDTIEGLRLTLEASEVGRPFEAKGTQEEEDQRLFTALRQISVEVEGSSPELAVCTAETAVDLFMSHLPHRSEVHGAALGLHAQALHLAGRHEAAAEKLEAGIKILREDIEPSIENFFDLAACLLIMSGFFEDAGLLDRALTAITESIDWFEVLIGQEAVLSFYYDQAIARQFSILSALNDRDAVKTAMDSRFELMRTRFRDLTVDDIIQLAGAYQQVALMHAQVRSAEALDAAHQYVLLTRLAWVMPEQVAHASSSRAEPPLKIALKEALIFLMDIAERNHRRTDFEEAMRELSELI